MAMAKLVCVLFLTLLAIFMIPNQVMAKDKHQPGTSLTVNYYGPGSLKSYQCPSQCSRRCSKTQHHKACMFFCQKCCAKCLCVPPGFYGNKSVCPCYNTWETKRGGPKCP